MTLAANGETTRELVTVLGLATALLAALVLAAVWRRALAWAALA